MKHTAEIKFIRTYSIAQWIRDLVIENDPNEQLFDFFEIDNIFVNKALKPCKKSILHGFILERLVSDFEYEARKWAECVEWNILTKKHLGYTIDCDRFDAYKDNYKDEVEEKIISDILPLISDEVFFLLFNDREFLYSFNKLISENIIELSKDEFPELLKKKGIVKRVKYWPKWLKKAIYYRDRGLCCSCYRDITGLINTQNNIHLDHIIPLKEGGTNDTSNIQLLCEICNLNKGSKSRKEKYLYIKPY